MTQPPSLRVLALTGDYPVVSKTFVTDQLAGLLRAGHQLDVVADQPDPSRAVPASRLPPEVARALRHRPPSPSVRAFRRLDTARLALRALGRRPTAVAHLLASAGPGGRRRRLLLALHTLLDAGHVDVVHCHFADLAPEVVAVRDMLGLRTAVVTSFHGFDLSRHVERTGGGAFKEVFASGELLLPVSEHWRRRLLEMGAPPERVHVQRMGVDPARFTPVPHLPAPEGVLRVLSIGRLVEKKGFHHGLDAVARLRDRGVPARYTLVGDGPLRGALEERVAVLDLGDRVELLGSRGRSEVRALLRSSDVLLCPSVTAADGDSEGIPMVLMEAMSTQLPVVASAHSGIPELVEDGRTGLLAPEGEANVLADHLERLLSSPELARQLGEAGRRRVEAEYDVGRLVVQLEQHLQAAVALRRAAS